MVANQRQKPKQAFNPLSVASFHGGSNASRSRLFKNRSLIPLSFRDVKKKGQKWLLIARSFDFFRELNTGLIFICRKAQIENHIASQIHFGIG